MCACVWCTRVHTRAGTYHQLEHELQRQPRVVLGVLYKPQHRLRVLEVPRHIHRLHVLTTQLQLRLREVRQAVLRLAHQFARAEQRVAYQTPRRQHAKVRGVAAVSDAGLGHARSTQAPDARPVGDVARRHTVQQHIQAEAADVVSGQHVRVKSSDPGQHKGQQCSLVADHHHIAVQLVLLQLSPYVQRHGDTAAWAADAGEVGQLAALVGCGAVDVDAVVDEAADTHHLMLVTLWVHARLQRQRHHGQLGQAHAHTHTKHTHTVRGKPTHTNTHTHT